MNIDFIKWMVGYADGFRFVEKMHDIECPDQMYVDVDLIVKNKVRWPLLLQRAIEEVNKKLDPLTQIDMFYDEDYGYMYIYKKLGSPWEKTIDQAKEAVLKYIYEQEK